MATVIMTMAAYVAYRIATFPYPQFYSLAERCSMSVTVVSSQPSQSRITATTSSGETIEVTSASRPAAGELITVWRTTGPDGRFTYEMLDGIPPMRP